VTSPPGRPARQGPRHQPADTRSRARRPGAQIRFEGRGYGARPDPADPRWRVAATVRLTSSDSRYSWLDGALAVWEGEFNEAAHHPPLPGLPPASRAGRRSARRPSPPAASMNPSGHCHASAAARHPAAARGPDHPRNGGTVNGPPDHDPALKRTGHPLSQRQGHSARLRCLTWKEPAPAEPPRCWRLLGIAPWSRGVTHGRRPGRASARRAVPLGGGGLLVSNEIRIEIGLEAVLQPSAPPPATRRCATRPSANP